MASSTCFLCRFWMRYKDPNNYLKPRNILCTPTAAPLRVTCRVQYMEDPKRHAPYVCQGTRGVSRGRNTQYIARRAYSGYRHPVNTPCSLNTSIRYSQFALDGVFIHVSSPSYHDTRDQAKKCPVLFTSRKRSLIPN